MIVRFRRGNMTETRPVHGKLDHHVSAARKRDGYKQLSEKPLALILGLR